MRMLFLWDLDPNSVEPGRSNELLCQMRSGIFGWSQLGSTCGCALRCPYIHLSSFTSSWEYITTLKYEFDVIRGHLTYRWTIWVRNNTQSFYACLLRFRLNFPFDRFTHSRAWPPLSQSFLTWLILTLWTQPALAVRWVGRPTSVFVTHSLTGHDPKAWLVFEVVGNPLI